MIRVAKVSANLRIPFRVFLHYLKTETHQVEEFRYPGLDTLGTDHGWTPVCTCQLLATSGMSPKANH
jgi:hypothetical protein